MRDGERNKKTTKEELLFIFFLVLVSISPIQQSTLFTKKKCVDPLPFLLHDLNTVNVVSQFLAT